MTNDPKKDKERGMVQVVASPGRTKDQNAPRVRVFDYPGPNLSKQTAPACTPRVVAKATANGYSMDLLLPWQSLSITPEVGMIVGTRFIINDGVSANRDERQRAIWLDRQAEARWMKLSPVCLAGAGCAMRRLPAAAWAGYDGA